MHILYVLAKIGFDRAENEPYKMWQILTHLKFQTNAFTQRKMHRRRPPSRLAEVDLGSLRLPAGLRRLHVTETPRFRGKQPREMRGSFGPGTPQTAKIGRFFEISLTTPYTDPSKFETQTFFFLFRVFLRFLRDTSPAFQKSLRILGN